MAAAAPAPQAGQSSPQNGLPSAVATIWDTRAVSAATGISASTSAVLSASASGPSSITVHPVILVGAPQPDPLMAASPR
jgi:hypothetical protein